MFKFPTPQEVIAADQKLDKDQVDAYFPIAEARVKKSGGIQFSLSDSELPPREGAKKVLLEALDRSGWTHERYHGRQGEESGYMIKPKRA